MYYLAIRSCLKILKVGWRAWTFWILTPLQFLSSTVLQGKNVPSLYRDILLFGSWGMLSVKSLAWKDSVLICLLSPRIHTKNLTSSVKKITQSCLFLMSRIRFQSLLLPIPKLPSISISSLLRIFQGFYPISKVKNCSSVLAERKELKL